MKIGPLWLKIQIACGDALALGPGKADLLDAISAHGFKGTVRQEAQTYDRARRAGVARHLQRARAVESGKGRMMAAFIRL